VCEKKGGEGAYLAQDWIEHATKGGDGSVSIAVVRSLRVPMVRVLFLH